MLAEDVEQLRLGVVEQTVLSVGADKERDDGG
jgi:hypothetical protein